MPPLHILKLGYQLPSGDLLISSADNELRLKALIPHLPLQKSPSKKSLQKSLGTISTNKILSRYHKELTDK